MKKLYFAFVFCAGLGVCGCHRNNESIVAEVNGEKITAEEFQKRYEQFMAEGGRRDNIVLRQQILNNMVNEHLIHLDIARQHFDSDSAYQRRMANIKDQALLDGYSKSISFDTLKITEPEVREEFRRYNTRVTARYLYAKSEEGAQTLKRRIDHGETFEALAKEVFTDPGLANNGGYLGSFGWGDMDPALEEAAFTLPLDSVSDPIKMKIGYGIVRVEKRVQQALASESDYAKVVQKLADAIQQKKIMKILTSAGLEIARGLDPKFNQQAVEIVFKNWPVLVGRNGPASIEEKSAIPKNISDMHFVDFKNQSWTIGQFVEKLNRTSEKQRRRVQSSDDVREIAVGLATQELLLDRAREKGLERDSTVQAEEQNLRERFLLRRWGDSVLDTVGNSGWDQRVLDSMYTANKKEYVGAPLVNVAEILVRTEQEAKSLRNKLAHGAKFADLARKNSIRLWAGKRGGELGYGTLATFGPMGEKFFKAKVGDIIGPEKVDPYWGVFRILDRKDGKQKSFEEAREDIINTLLPLRKQQASKRAVDQLRAGAHIVVNNDILANIVIQTDNQVRR